MQISTIALALVLSLAGRQATAMDAPCYSTTSSGAGLRALVLTTSHDKLGNESCTSCKPTGVYGEEFTTPYYVFKDAGAEVTLASIKGGQIPVDPTYNNSLIMSKADKRFWGDSDALSKASNTVSVDNLDMTQFDIIFMAGGWGAAWDLGTSAALGEKISKAYANEKQVLGSVCHGSLGFILARKPDGSLVTKGTHMTGVTDRQIDQLGIAKVTPMHPEDALKAGGAIYECKHGLITDLHSNKVVVDGRIVTGQNQQGSCQVAQKLLELAGEARQRIVTVQDSTPYALAPSSKCRKPVANAICYQGVKSTIDRVVKLDPLSCPVSKGLATVSKGNCSSLGYTKYIANDPIFREAGLWRK